MLQYGCPHSPLGLVLQVFLLSFCLIIFPSVNPFGRNTEQKELYTPSSSKLTSKQKKVSPLLFSNLSSHPFLIHICWVLGQDSMSGQCVLRLNRFSFFLHYCSHLPDLALTAIRKHRCHLLPWAWRGGDSLSAPCGGGERESYLRWRSKESHSWLPEGGAAWFGIRSQQQLLGRLPQSHPG